MLPFVALALNLAEAITVWPSDNILCSKFISSSLLFSFSLFPFFFFFSFINLGRRGFFLCGVMKGIQCFGRVTEVEKLRGSEVCYGEEESEDGGIKFLGFVTFILEW